MTSKPTMTRFRGHGFIDWLDAACEKHLWRELSLFMIRCAKCRNGKDDSHDEEAECDKETDDIPEKNRIHKKMTTLKFVTNNIYVGGCVKEL